MQSVTHNFTLLLFACFLGAMEIFTSLKYFSKPFSACLPLAAFSKETAKLYYGLVHKALAT
jgi:hypothetical protein